MFNTDRQKETSKNSMSEMSVNTCLKGPPEKKDISCIHVIMLNT